MNSEKSVKEKFQNFIGSMKSSGDNLLESLVHPVGSYSVDSGGKMYMNYPDGNKVFIGQEHIEYNKSSMDDKMNFYRNATVDFDSYSDKNSGFYQNQRLGHHQWVPNTSDQIKVVPWKISEWGNINEEENTHDYEELLEKIKKSNTIKTPPNKVDKELVDTKVPYNVKKDLNNNLIYEFACAGYTSDRIEVSVKKDGLLLKLLKEDSVDDLIGEEFEYLCKGIKENDQEISIFIDSDEYVLSNTEIELENGLLFIKVFKRVSQLSTVIKVKKKKSNREKIELI